MDVQVGLDNKGFATELADMLGWGRGVSVSQVLVLVYVTLGLKLLEANVALGTLHLVVGEIDVLFNRALVTEQLATDFTRELGYLQVFRVHMVF